MNSISVIIRTKNSEKTIKACLDHLFQQTIQVDEMIVVDSGSTDATLDLIKSSNCRTLHYPKESFNYSKALNIGISAAKSDYILVLSSHVILENPKTIEFMLRFLQENNSICAVSTYRKRKNNPQINQWNTIDWLVYTLNNFEGTAMFNPCSLFRKKHWEEHPFDENLPAAEDQEWIHYFMKKYNYGAVVIYNPYTIYLNHYFNTYKVARDMITIGQYIYPPLLSFKNVFILLSLKSLGSLIKGDVKKVFINYRFAFMWIKMKLGLKININSNYSKKLK